MASKIIHGIAPKNAPNQGVLEHVVRNIFPGEIRKEANIISPTTGAYLELDIWLPDLKLSFEFQDPYHYTTSWYAQSPIDEIKQIDAYKRRQVEEIMGETLIVVPCWWDGQQESLIATIKKKRPELLANFNVSCDPISDEPPPNLFKYGIVPDVGEMMLASFPPIALHFSRDISMTNSWWLGEKYDGVRCCWNSIQNTLYARSGVSIPVPEGVNKQFGKFFLDGEIWFGRGYFTDSVKLKSNLDNSTVNWSGLRMVAFDDPDPETNNVTFEKRYEKILSNVTRTHPFIIIASRVKCEKKQHLTNATQQIINGGGEGVILRKPESLYEHGRSKCLLKLKATRGDQEALVVDILETGPHEELMLQLVDGTKFKVPTPKQEDLPVLPDIGDVVMFSYENYSKLMLPIEPKVQRIREDLSWDEVIENSKRDNIKEFEASSAHPDDLLNLPSRKVIANHAAGHWAADKRGNMRIFFESFARERGFDPFVPENWYNFQAAELYEIKGANTILNYFKGSYVRAIMAIFPDIGLEKSQFLSLPRWHWHDVKNRRAFFETYAQEHGFNPLVPENWYDLSANTVRSTTRGQSVLGHYNGSFVKALLHLFPDIGFDIDKFAFLPLSHWDDKVNQREYMNMLALKCGFDPLVKEMWYSFRFTVLLNSRRGRTLTSYYDGSTVKLLAALYPEHNFDQTKFKFVAANFWKDLDNRKAFFMEFARTNNFDPLIPDNWYKYKAKIERERRVNSIIRYYKGSTLRAIMHNFPDIGLEKHKFHNLPSNHWKDKNNRREFFEQVAKEKGFDPLNPENWYNLQFFRETKRANSVLRYYDSSYAKALIDNFPEVTFDLERFPRISHNHWEHVHNRRELFEKVAKKMGFDPLLPENWYKLSKDDFLSQKRVASVMNYYNSFYGALFHMFPEIGLDRKLLPKVPHQFEEYFKRKQEAKVKARIEQQEQERQLQRQNEQHDLEKELKRQKTLQKQKEYVERQHSKRTKKKIVG